MVRKKKRAEPEYRLRVFRAHGDRKNAVAVVIETVKEFVSFPYEVLLSDERSSTGVEIKILGLHAPRSVMPGTGHARGFRLYERLPNPFSLMILSPDGAADEFTLKVGSREVVIIRSPKESFLEFSTEPVELPE